MKIPAACGQIIQLHVKLQIVHIADFLAKSAQIWQCGRETVVKWLHGMEHVKSSSFILFLCTYYHIECSTYHTNAYNNNLSPKHVCVR